MKKRNRFSPWALNLALFGLGILVGAVLTGKSRTQRTAGELRNQLSFANGVTVTTVGNVVLATGEAESLSDYQRIEEVIATLQSNAEGAISIRSIVRLSESAKTVVADLIERQIGSPEITVRAFGETLVLEGTADGDFEADRALEFTLTSVRSRAWKEAARVVARADRGDGKYTATEALARQNPWPAKVLDMMRVRPRAPKKASLLEALPDLRVKPIAQ